MPSPPAFKSLKVFDYDYTYLDSGPPPSNNYTTWIIVHGFAFNGGSRWSKPFLHTAIFEKLLPLAHVHNLRIVSVNRRGYPPSSGFQEDELNVVGKGKKFDEAEPFYRAQGIEIATFLSEFAEEEGIPPADPNDPTSGIVLIGWSLGTSYALAVLAFADQLREDTRSTLQKHLHTVLLHDPSPNMLGIPIPEGSYSFMSEPDDSKRFDLFLHWVTGHYTHKSIVSGNIDDLEFDIPSDQPHSLDELSREQRDRYTHLDPFRFTGCDFRFLTCHISAFAEVAKRALFDKLRAEALPSVRVSVMSGGTSPGLLIWCTWALRGCLDDPKGLYGHGAERARDIKIVNQVVGNHFIGWQDPEMSIQHYSASVRGQETSRL